MCIFRVYSEVCFPDTTVIERLFVELLGLELVTGVVVGMMNLPATMTRTRTRNIQYCKHIAKFTIKQTKQSFNKNIVC